MSLSLSVALVYGCEVERADVRRARGIDNDPRVEPWPINDGTRCVVFARGSHVSLAQGVHDVRREVFDVSAQIAGVNPASLRGWDADVRAALSAAGIKEPRASRWMVVCDAS